MRGSLPKKLIVEPGNFYEPETVIDERKMPMEPAVGRRDVNIFRTGGTKVGYIQCAVRVQRFGKTKMNRLILLSTEYKEKYFF